MIFPFYKKLKCFWELFLILKGGAGAEVYKCSEHRGKEKSFDPSASTVLLEWHFGGTDLILAPPETGIYVKAVKAI